MCRLALVFACSLAVSGPAPGAAGHVADVNLARRGMLAADHAPGAENSSSTGTEAELLTLQTRINALQERAKALHIQEAQVVVSFSGSDDKGSFPNSRALDRMLKSLLTFATCYIKLFVVTDVAGAQHMVDFVQTSQARGLEVTIHVLDSTAMTGFLDSINAGWSSYTTLFTVSKHLAVDLFPNLGGRFITVDNDIIFGTDICGTLVDAPVDAKTWASIPTEDETGQFPTEATTQNFDSIVVYSSAAQLRTIRWPELLVQHGFTSSATTEQSLDNRRMLHMHRFTNNIRAFKTSWKLRFCSRRDGKSATGFNDSTVDALHTDCMKPVDKQPETAWYRVARYWDLYPTNNLMHLRGALVQYTDNENILWV